MLFGLIRIAGEKESGDGYAKKKVVEVTAKAKVAKRATPYEKLATSLGNLIQQARRQTARVVNVILTATYWEIGRRIVEFEQQGVQRALYGDELLMRLSDDLSTRHGRGFAKSNLYLMRSFYLAYTEIFQTVSGKLKDDGKDTHVQIDLRDLVERFPLPWSHYARLLSVEKAEARSFYECEALRGGWSVRQLDRQIATQFYERTLMSKNKRAMLRKGQMHMYLNYAREHWMRPDENPPVGLILCAEQNRAVARYALDGLPNKIMATEYRVALPKEAELVAQTRKLIAEMGK